MACFKKIDGGKCYLSPIDLEDAALFTGWLNDLDVLRYLNLSSVNITLESEREALEKISREHNYCIVDGEKDRVIGVCGFLSVDNLNRTAELGIFIGDKSYWGKGYGSRAIECLLYYGFEYLNLHSVLLQTYDYNERGLGCYKKVGFHEIGRRRQALHRESRFRDIIYMDILKNEFFWRPAGRDET